MNAHTPHRPAALCSLVALLGASFGCAAPVGSINVNVVTTACSFATAIDLQRNPTLGVDQITFTITGDGLAPITVNAPFGSNTASIPNVPIGTHRRIVATATNGGLVRSRADSGLFDNTGSGNAQITLFLRVVDAFVFTNDSSGTTCSHLNTPRAGHQMTALPDGRVLITGGYTLDGAGARQYLTQAELYDPADGTFSNVDAPQGFARAGHAALPVTVGGAQQVLLLGGEGPSFSGSVGPIGSFELYNNGQFSKIALPQSVQSRERAATVVDVKTGYAVLGGGANGPDVPGGSLTVFSSLAYFDPTQSAIIQAAQPLAQGFADAVAVSRKNAAISGGTGQGGVVFIGGRDQNGNALAQISGVIFNEAQHQYVADTTYEQPALRTLPAPRVQHSAIVATDDTVLILGGATSVTTNYATTTDAITVIEPRLLTVGNASEVLSQQRADGCAALLNSGEIIYAGGAWNDGSSLHSTSSVDIVSPAGVATSVRALEGPTPGGTWGLQSPRHGAACLKLADGTVLVTGGLQFESASGSPTTLGSAEIYTP